MKYSPNITLIGLGNLNYQLAKGLEASGIIIDQIYNRSALNEAIADSLNHVRIVHNLSDLLPSSDLYIVSVSDDALDEVVAQLTLYLPSTSLICHTSGSISMHVFSSYFKEYGALWPLQSFSIEDEIKWTDIPLIISASTERLQSKLTSIAQRLSDNIHVYSDQKRQNIHVAAVIANNFTNALIAKHIISY